MPLDKAPLVYLEPALSGATFFSYMESFCNGVPVDPAPHLGVYSWIYQVLNRTRISEEIMKEKYGHVIPRVSNAEENNSTTLSETMKKAMLTLQFDSKIASKGKVLKFGMDSYWPFDGQSSIARALTGVKNEAAWIPPGAQINLRLHKQSPLDAVVQYPSVPDTTYFSTTVAPARPVITWTIKSLAISYETLQLESAERMAAYRKHHMEFFQDIPRLILAPVSETAMMTIDRVYIEPGSRFLLLTWVYSDQVIFNATSKKTMSPKFLFPPNAKKIEFHIDGKPVNWERGVTELGTSSAHESLDCYKVHEMQVHRGVYSKGVQYMFPQQGKSYDCVFLFDLSMRKVPHSSEMIVTTMYGDAGSEKKVLLCSVTVSQHKATYKDGHALEFKLIP